MRRASGPRRPIAGPLLTATTIGLGVAVAALAFGGGSCPTHEVVGFGSSCRGLIASLAVRVGVTAGVVVLLARLVAHGLARTAETLERDRTVAEEER